MRFGQGKGLPKKDHSRQHPVKVKETRGGSVLATRRQERYQTADRMRAAVGAVPTAAEAISMLNTKSSPDKAESEWQKHNKNGPATSPR